MKIYSENSAPTTVAATIATMVADLDTVYSQSSCQSDFKVFMSVRTVKLCRGFITDDGRV